MIQKRCWVICLFLVVGALLLWYGPAWADGPQQQGENEKCLSCHSDQKLSMSLSGGETLTLFVDGEKFAQSAHGENELKCTSCHTDLGEYPHPALTAASLRDFRLERTQCQQCHQNEAQYNVHGQLLAEGNNSVAVCTDCHSAHAVAIPSNTSATITPLCSNCHQEAAEKYKDSVHGAAEASGKAAPTCVNCHSAHAITNSPGVACANCHGTVYDEYKNSVHGQALSEEANEDVPTCANCHGSHAIADPYAASFGLDSSGKCAECHADQAVMSKYGLSTASHGLPTGASSETAFCYDCHGVHNQGNPADSVRPRFFLLGAVVIVGAALGVRASQANRAQRKRASESAEAAKEEG